MAHRTPLPAILLTFLALSPLPLPAAAQRELSPSPYGTLVASARRTLFEALDNPDPAVRREAIVMLRHEGSPEAYGRIAALFRDFALPVAEPGLPLYWNQAIATLYAIDAERTVRWLQEHNDEVLERFDLYELFSVIGFERVADFDNLFLYTLGGYGASTLRQAMMKKIHVAQIYRRTGEEKYRKILAFSAWNDPAGTPEELARLHEYLRGYGLPVEPLRLVMEERGGIGAGREVTGRTFTLEELLYQALLRRFGYTREVYRTRFDLSASEVVYAPGALERHGLEDGREEFQRVLGDLSAFPSLGLDESVAYLFAGVPRPGDLDTIVEGLPRLTPPDRLRYLGLIIASPESGTRRTLLRRYATFHEAAVRITVLEALVSSPGYLTREEILGRLGEEAEPEAIGRLLEALGNLGIGADLDVFARYLGHGSGIVRSVAAGQILRAAGEGKRP